jgi:hypothetical protein
MGPRSQPHLPRQARGRSALAARLWRRLHGFKWQTRASQWQGSGVAEMKEDSSVAVWRMDSLRWRGAGVASFCLVSRLVYSYPSLPLSRISLFGFPSLSLSPSP